MKTTAKIAAVLLVLALVGSTSAEVITVQVEGVVDHISTEGGLVLDGSVGLGSTMTGFCTYDTETPDELPVNENLGFYTVTSISMTIGNYTFSQDATSPDLPYFRVSSTVDPGYFVSSDASRFDGTVYINGSPKTYEDITWSWTYLALLVLGTSSSEYIPTDALPDLDSWPDLSIFDMVRGFETRFNEEGGNYFNIYGEFTSLTVIPEPAKTYYVNAAEGSDDNDGLSPETPFATIQKAIDSAFDGDTVIVADGTYTGPGNRDIDFLGKAITVKSENGPATCVIDCQGSQGNEHRGFDFHNNEDSNSVLNGFTITNGYVFGDLEGDGGGVYCYASSPMITNCNISWNVAVPGWDWGGNGGGIYSKGGNPTISNCTISSNWASTGGGILCDNSNPTINDCIISDNTAQWGCGGGIFSRCYSSPTLTNCTISRNEANCGGGIDIYYSSNPTLISCTITGNLALSDSSGFGGGGISSRCDSIPTLTDCTISDNIAQEGGGIHCNDSSPTIRNCAITGNSADYGGGIYSTYFSNPILANCTFVANSALNGNALSCDSYQQRFLSNVQMVNCILWNSGNEIWNNDGSTITITYTDIQGGYEGEGNIDLDPCLVDPNAGDYHLSEDSPCIDTGDPNYIAEPNETDLDGNPRIIDGNDDGASVVDMGAYEFYPPVEAEMKLTPQMLNCNSKGKYIKAHFVLPEGFLPGDVNVNEPALAEPMGIESEYIKVFGSKDGPVKLEISFDREAFCYLLTDDDSLEVTVIGSLTTSRYFYATDTIKIKPRR